MRGHVSMPFAAALEWGKNGKVSYDAGDCKRVAAAVWLRACVLLGRACMHAASATASQVRSRTSKGDCDENAKHLCAARDLLGLLDGARAMKRVARGPAPRSCQGEVMKEHLPSGIQQLGRRMLASHQCILTRESAQCHKVFHAHGLWNQWNGCPGLAQIPFWVPECCCRVDAVNPRPHHAPNLRTLGKQQQGPGSKQRPQLDTHCCAPTA